MPWYVIIFAPGGMLLLLCGGCLLLMRTCLIVITVQGQSMSPTLEDGDRVLAIRPVWSYRLRKGQMVLFRQAGFDEAPENPDLSLHIKRIVALAGEQYCSLTTPSGYHEYVTQKDHAYIWQIPRGHVFVCGDNREQSIDSRNWGLLPLHNVRGIVARKLAPVPAFLPAQVDKA